MRIIAGYAKGRALAGPKDDRVRPTTDRVRESLFAILGDFEDCIVLDGYAGTGALGCEALSRGATHVYFYDAAQSSIALVEENVKRLEARDRATITHLPFARGLELLEHEPDVVFLDPPYGKGLAQLSLELLANSPRITSRALIVVEDAISAEPVQHPAFELDDERLYGDTRMRFLLRI